jgi:uroporphyrinogen decarboxylase
MSYEKFCFALYDDPALVKAIVEKVGNLFIAYYQQLAELPNLIALFQGDDMGFRSGTLARPDTLRELFLPWHKRFADIARRRGIPYFLHSCGDLSAIYEDLINDVGISGKHSFEDAILPAPEFQKLYGDRIATLGGVDVDILAGSTPEHVRARTRELMTICGARGRFAVGSGNSIPSYIPLENYLTMVDTALTF